MKIAAKIVIHDAASMTKQGRRRIAKWMESRAKWLVKHGELASKRFVQHYMYEPGK